MLGDRIVQQWLEQRSTFRVGHTPADHAPAKDVEDDVEIEIRPFRRPHQLGVSRPEEFHLRPLAEPDVNLSAHPAPTIQPMDRYGLQVMRDSSRLPG